MSKQDHFVTTAEVLTKRSRYTQYTRKAITAMHKATLGAGSGTQNTPKQNATTISTRSGKAAADIDALFAARPLTLQFALDAIEDRGTGSSLNAVQYLIIALKLPAEQKGEDYNILRFEEEPLSYSVRITGCPNVRSRSVYIHKEAEGKTQEFSVNGERDLKAIARHILSYKAQLESGTGFLKAAPKSDSALLAVLKEKQWNEQHVPQFAEAQRAVSRHCLLDATVELLTPFGLQPVEYERSRVLVDLLAKKTKQQEHEPVDIMIERLGKYLSLPVAQDSEDERSDSTYGSSQRFETPTINAATAVIITRLKSNYAVQIKEDSKRYPVHVLRGTRYTSYWNVASLPKRALVFDLSSHSDVVAFVSRILTQRNEIRTDYIEPFEILSERYGWGKRQQSPPRTLSQNEKRRLACRERETGLRAEVTVEALLEEDNKKAEMLRRQEEEARRKEEDLRITMERMEEMRGNWAARVEDMLDRAGEPGGVALDERSMSWADMVEEDLGT